MKSITLKFYEKFNQKNLLIKKNNSFSYFILIIYIVKIKKSKI